MLTFTVYQLLSVLSPTLKSGDLDPCMSMLIDVRTFCPGARARLLAPPCGFHPCCASLITSLALLQIFNNELFGAVAEEKEVKGIISKLMEARHSKSMDSYEVLARFCSKESITKLILPLKEVSKEGLEAEVGVTVKPLGH